MPIDNGSTCSKFLLGEIKAYDAARDIGDAICETFDDLSPVRQSAGGVTVTENEEKDGVEIRFASKPDPATLERIKTAGGWRWSKFSKCWYHKGRTAAARAFANSFLETARACQKRSERFPKPVEKMETDYPTRRSGVFTMDDYRRDNQE